jgi:hypothetical protein
VASPAWDQTGGDPEQPDKYNELQGGSFAGKTINEIRFFPQAHGIHCSVHAVRHFSGEMLRP